MHSSVGSKVSIATEDFTALSTLKWLLPRVGPLVPDEGGSVAEPGPALGALEGLFTGVGPAVLDKMRALAEAFATL